MEIFWWQGWSLCSLGALLAQPALCRVGVRAWERESRKGFIQVLVRCCSILRAANVEAGKMP